MAHPPALPQPAASPATRQPRQGLPAASRTPPVHPPQPHACTRAPQRVHGALHHALIHVHMYEVTCTGMYMCPRRYTCAYMHMCKHLLAQTHPRFSHQHQRVVGSASSHPLTTEGTRGCKAPTMSPRPEQRPGWEWDRGNSSCGYTGTACAWEPPCPAEPEGFSLGAKMGAGGSGRSGGAQAEGCWTLHPTTTSCPLPTL